jgi:hypothetical protein
MDDANIDSRFIGRLIHGIRIHCRYCLANPYGFFLDTPRVRGEHVGDEEHWEYKEHQE